MYRAEAALGRAVLKLWRESPGVAVLREHPGCAAPLKRVNEIETRVSELEERLGTLRTEKP
jgi:hypothetical protein